MKTLGEVLQVLNEEDPLDWAKPVLVADQDGFIHQITDLIWDEGDGCFYLVTEWRN